MVTSRGLPVTTLVTTLLALCIGGCSSRSDRDEHVFRIYEEGSITIAETRGGPKYTGELFEYELVTEIREDPDRPESLLYNPDTIWIDESGTVFVSDYGNRRIVVFDQNGLIVTTASVVGYARYVDVTTTGGARYKGTVLGIDPTSDVAII